MEKKVMVTGGAGFIGSHLVELLLNNGWIVKIFDNFSNSKREKSSSSNLEIIEGDIRDFDHLLRAMYGVDYVFHLAAQVSVQESIASTITHDVNVIGTENVFKAAWLSKVKKVIFSSSCAIYGNLTSGALVENCVPAPMNPYAESKLKGEQIANRYFKTGGLDSVCLRYFNVYGPRQRADSTYAAVIPMFMKCAAQNTPPTIYGDGNQTRDFVYVKDVARANMIAAEYQKTGIFNVGTGESTSINELWKLVSKGMPPVYKPARSGEIYHSRSDNTLAQTELKFLDRMSIKDGLSLMESKTAGVQSSP
jgi:UDP-glucose 4-epimerase